MRSIGLHLRLATTMPDLARQAHVLGLSIFQSFCVFQQTGKMIEPTCEEIDEFIKLRTEFFNVLYLHGSYWINLARDQYNAVRTATKELQFASTHMFDYMVIHPGSVFPGVKKTEGIEILAKNLNKLLKKQTSVKILLENTAHGKGAIGSDLNDFKLLLELIEKPEQLFYCLDTAHAYVYGYSIISSKGIEQFIKTIEATIGIDRVLLLHVNDTMQKLGSRIDEHCEPGQGLIGEKWLSAFINHPLFSSKPIISEPPIMQDEQLKKIIFTLKRWTDD